MYELLKKIIDPYKDQIMTSYYVTFATKSQLGDVHEIGYPPYSVLFDMAYCLCQEFEDELYEKEAERIEKEFYDVEQKQL